MGSVMMKIRVMPSDVDVDLNEVLEKIKNIQMEGVEIRDSAIQPIAFGLKAIVLMAVMPDMEGIGDRYIEEIGKIEGVESVEIEDMELL
ncbi:MULTISPECIES: elongation factor 1-beta [Archaeoglobus]|jgi:elongation factor 1-beta|uniref:Elongation factor 1-beta n=2 Tax=Archaeoglobus fulgidus TaxID=2234 RepID=EF1B_ARCFU|nr:MULTISPECIES: elongation factor 1-beta [Archaeoglobus]O29681.1 RecName: Full=Elongation factor 1-beta; Short=EF-1-beta; AltName: Full=aEF-1beta [Archaeoglobus fulgidus DSM 4304]AAB90666.1 translation elongation factor EF-1, subunit beta [Archaeoglobus fulgidus DSM 4304]KUJ93083.1 MAG: Elongation factor 1-beta [Archaeoglobus fulgidus]KUK06822.1 MAG: Elongation factor 1-beta [Archaeoglobus fulgidus]MDI3498029.1 elongation factor 1-beta [Archaeoglobus sp.]